MQSLISYLRPFRKELIVGPFFKLLEAMFELLVPFLMISIIDKGIAHKDIGYVLTYGAYMISLGIVGYGCSLICQYYASRASQGVGTEIRNKVFANILALSHMQIQGVGTNSLITRMTNDINQLQLAVAMLIRLVVRAPFIVVGSVAMAIYIQPQMTMIFVVTIPIMMLVLYVVMTKAVPYYQKTQRTNDHLSQLAKENLSGMRVIRAFGAQQRQLMKFTTVSAQGLNLSLVVGRITGMLNPLTSLVVNMAILIIIYQGAAMVDVGQMTQGEVIALVNYLLQILLALIVVANLIVLFTKAMAAAIRISEILEMTPDIDDSGDQIVAHSSEKFNYPHIQFQQVTFSYEHAKLPILKDINLAIHTGEKIGIIGGTGTGKSTLIKLIPRIYDVVDGAILFQGQNIKTMPLDMLRKHIRIVGQKAAFLSDTVANNLKIAYPTASDAQLWHCLEIAQAADFVRELPEGLETLIEQGGQNFSGGQKQRLAIARSLVGTPKVLILDDSTSALDYVTDAAFFAALSQHLTKTTLIIVSQRINAIRGMDRIVVLEEGEIAAIGNHTQLLESNEIYREIARLQLSAEELEKYE